MSRYPMAFGPVKVYLNEHKTRGSVYQVYWREADGREQRKQFKAAQDAWNHAETTQRRLQLGLKQSDVLNVPDAQIYHAALKKVAKTGMGLLEVVDDYMRTWRPDLQKKTFQDVFTDYMDSLMAASLSHKKDMKWRGAAFCAKFGKRYIDEIQMDEIKAFLNGRAQHPRTWNNWLMVAKTIFNWGVKYKWLRISPLDGIDPHRIRPNKKVLMPSGDLLQLLLLIVQHEHADELYPYVCLLAFAGVRTEEAKRVEFSDFIWENNVLTSVLIKDPKTEQRSVAINKTLRYHITGRLMDENTKRPKQGKWRRHYQEPDKEIRKLAKKNGIAWPRNCLRHSYATHFLKLWKKPDYCAYQMGTSTAMFRRTYEGLSSESESIAWFTETMTFGAMSQSEEKVQAVDNSALIKEITGE